MTVRIPADRYRILLLTIIAVVLSAAALRASYPVTMPLLFAIIIIAALWPIKLWLSRWLPSWLSYLAVIMLLVLLLAAFLGAIYFSVGQTIGTFGRQWPKLEASFESVRMWAADHGIVITAPLDRERMFAMGALVLSNLYSFATYTGFIGLLVMLGLPEVPRLESLIREHLEKGPTREVVDAARSISTQVRRYFATTFATSLLTGIASAAWSLATGLELALVWGLLNFLLNFIPVIGNIIGIIPPVLYAVVQFDGYGMPLLVLAGFVVLQLTISNFVYPLLQGRRLTISPWAIIVAMAFWAWMWGIAGALIAVPLTAAMIIICRHFERSRWIAVLLSSEA